MEQDNPPNQPQELASNSVLPNYPTGYLSTEFLCQIINKVADPIFVKNRRHEWILINDAFCRFLGRDRQELIGKSDYDFFPPSEADIFWEKDELVFTTSNMVENEEYLTDAEGVLHYVFTQKSLFIDISNNKYIIGTIRDTLRYKRVEEDLRKTEARIQKLSENVPGMIYQFQLNTDNSISYPYVSSGAYEIYGLTPEEIQTDAQLIRLLVHPHERDRYEESIAISAQTLQPWVWEGRIILNNGKIKWVQCVSRPELQADGSIIWDGLVMDATTRKQGELELQQAYEELEKRVEGRTRELQASNKSLQIQILERQLAESELRNSQQRLALLIRQTPVAVIEWNTKFEIQEWNPSAERIFGYSKTEILGHGFAILVPNIARDNADEIITNTLKDKVVNPTIRENLTKDNRIIFCEWYNSPLIAENGEVIGVASMVLDITKRKLAERSLMLYRQAVDTSSDAIAMADGSGNHIYQNPAFSNLYECETVEKFISLGGTAATFTNTKVAQEVWKATNSGQSWIGEVEQKSFGGRIMQTFIRSYPLKDATGKNIGLVSAITDITESKRAEVQLREQEQFLRSIYEGVEHLIFVINVLENGELIYAACNSASEKVLSIRSADVIGKTPEQVFGAEEGTSIRHRFLKSLKTGKSTSYEESLTLDDEKNWFITTINPLKNGQGKIYRLVGTAINISKRKKVETQLKKQAVDLEKALQELQQAQMQLIQSEKMSSLGQLVAGIAHEINNPVNFIYGNLNYANDYIQDLIKLVKLYQECFGNSPRQVAELIEAIDLDFIIEDLPKLLQSMEVGADRIREIVISLRTFSRMDEADMKVVDIHEGIDSTLMILEHRLKVTPHRIAIEVVKEYSDLPLVECYPGQLNQVFMNILANAIDAMEESIFKGEMVNDPQIHIQTKLLESNQVTISIIDNGVGVAEDVKQRLFDPFFTTKPIGKGTGMGLSISYQIITQRHGGSLECVSQSGQGAKFVITIPLYQSETYEISQLN